MTPSFKTRSLAGWLCLLPLSLALAAPGAHGPNGEHLDQPGAAALASAGAPRFESHSDLFEIVGRIEPAGLLLYINRYETNEAVMGAKLDVELGAAKATAAFQAETGTYLVTDKALLATLGKAGTHPLVFTITAGADSDLLDGQLVVTAHDHEAHADTGSGLGLSSRAALLGGGALIVVVALAALRRSRKNKAFGAA